MIMMFFPTVYSAVTDELHIVKDKSHCICGEKYNVFPMLSRKDLRKIRFRHYKTVTCTKCREHALALYRQAQEQNA